MPMSHAYHLDSPATPGQKQRVEGMLATARAYLSTWCLLAVILDPAERAAFPSLVVAVLSAYAVSSVLVALLLRAHTEPPRGATLAIHAADVSWATAATALTGGLTSPFFVLFLFALLGAAYRWGSWETLITAGAGVLLMASPIVLAPATALPDARLGPLALRALGIRSGFLIVMAYLLGYLADEEKRSQARTAILDGVMVRIQGETGLQATLASFLDEVLRIFAARGAQLAVADADSGRAYLWEAGRGAQARGIQLRVHEMDADGRARHLFDLPGDAWRAARAEASGPGGFTVLALDERGTRAPSGSPPLGWPVDAAARGLVAASASFGSQWRGRLFLVDPDPRVSAPELRVLQALVRRAAPAIHAAHLVSRLRARAGAAERARVARELHDGVIQSLLGLEMQVDVLRRQALAKSLHTAGSLTHIQALLHQEVVAVRELMDQMRAVEVGPGELLDRLAGMVDRFERETGIRARFVSEVRELSLSSALCREVARMVQEALVNVRRHSGASHVVVRFGRQDGLWALTIDDDGQGFAFAGRLDLAALDTERKGPLVIKERVRAAGGRLTIDSRPGHGARLEILISPERHG
jgi:signal transduction histidine kinase